MSAPTGTTLRNPGTSTLDHPRQGCLRTHALYPFCGPYLIAVGICQGIGISATLTAYGAQAQLGGSYGTAYIQGVADSAYTAAGVVSDDTFLKRNLSIKSIDIASDRLQNLGTGVSIVFLRFFSTRTTMTDQISPKSGWQYAQFRWQSDRYRFPRRYRLCFVGSGLDRPGRKCSDRFGCHRQGHHGHYWSQRPRRGNGHL